MSIGKAEFEAAVEAFAAWKESDPNEPSIDVGADAPMLISTAIHHSKKSAEIMPRSLHHTILGLIKDGHARHFPDAGGTYERGRQEMVRLVGERKARIRAKRRLTGLAA